MKKLTMNNKKKLLRNLLSRHACNSQGFLKNWKG